ncbi:hypothetical protein [Pseudomonas sp. LjRoot277]|uniref:hypothetical protein n=1 Tax=Pseudomonas sp. LjRoot277 TaxID=3342307 RepID=UPI003F4FC433
MKDVALGTRITTRTSSQSLSEIYNGLWYLLRTYRCLVRQRAAVIAYTEEDCCRGISSKG